MLDFGHNPGAPAGVRAGDSANPSTFGTGPTVLQTTVNPHRPFRRNGNR